MSLRAAIPLYQQRGLVLITAPASEPVTAEELRLHVRASGSEFPDAAAIVTEARSEIENRTGVAFITQSWKLALDRWPAGGEQWWDGVREGSITELYGSNTLRSVDVPRWPLQSITSVTVYGESGTPSTVTLANVFDVDTYRVPGRMTLKRGAAWPVALRGSNAIEVVFAAGYTSAANVPAYMKRAIKQLAAYNYAHRGDDCDPADAFHASGAETIMRQYMPLGV